MIETYKEPAIVTEVAESRSLSSFPIMDLIVELETRLDSLPHFEEEQFTALKELYNMAAEKDWERQRGKETPTGPKPKEAWELENDKALVKFYEAISSLVGGAAEAIGTPSNEAWKVLDRNHDEKMRRIAMTFPYGSTEARLDIIQAEPVDKEFTPITIDLIVDFTAGAIRRYEIGRLKFSSVWEIIVHYSPGDTYWSKDIRWPLRDNEKITGQGLCNSEGHRLVDKNGADGRLIGIGFGKSRPKEFLN